jgi:hypothetical protein
MATNQLKSFRVDAQTWGKFELICKKQRVKPTEALRRYVEFSVLRNDSKLRLRSDRLYKAALFDLSRELQKSKSQPYAERGKNNFRIALENATKPGDIENIFERLGFYINRVSSDS